MDHTQALAQEVVTDTATPEVENQAEAVKSYTQDEVDNMMARMRGSMERKFQKTFDELGDIEQLRQLKQDAEQREMDQQLKRGEFEKTLQDMAATKDAEIHKRDNIIKEYRVNTPILDAAARYKAVAPEQVKALLANQVRLNDIGEVEVVDTTGSVRYDDSGNVLEVNTLVKEFLEKNPHFVQPTPSTSNTKSSFSGDAKEIDISKLDMSNPEHRKKYAELRNLRK